MTFSFAFVKSLTFSDFYRAFLLTHLKKDGIYK
jgi:hypothetical protein